MRRRTVVAGAAVLCALSGYAAVPALAADPTVTVDVTPAAPTVQQQTTVSGTVTDANGDPVPGATLSATRTDSAGETPLPPDATDSSGHYDFTDTPTAYGEVTWTVTWSSENVSGHRTVTVSRRPTDVGIHVDDRTVRSGRKVHITAHLGSPTTDRELRIYARPYNKNRRLVAEGPVDESGDLTATYEVDRRTRLVAVFNGDDTYAPGSAGRSVRVRAVVSARLTGWYDRSHGFRIVHVGADPTLKGHLRPELNDACLHFRAQHYYSGRWHGRTTSGCVRTDRDGRVSSLLTGDHVINDPYRVRVLWRRHPVALAAHSRWIKLRFRG